MSTKIYNAYKYNWNFDQFMKDILDFRQDILDDIAPSIIKVMDMLNGEDIKKELVDKLNVRNFEIQKFLTHSVLDERENWLEVAVFFDGKKIYCIFYGCERWQKLLWDRFEDYHYQNSTDNYSWKSDRSYKYREKKRDKLMPTGIPAETCLIYAVLQDRHIRRAVSKIRHPEESA